MVMARLSKSTNEDLLRAALEGLQMQKHRIEEQIAEIRGMLGMRTGRGGGSAPDKGGGGGRRGSPASRKRVLSEAGRRRIAAAQKRRWAAYRKASEQKDQVSQRPHVAARRTVSRAA